MRHQWLGDLARERWLEPPLELDRLQFLQLEGGFKTFAHLHVGHM